MSGWTKLFSSIVTSSIWVEEDSTLRVWVAMLATADADGIVEGSVPGFANLARVTTDQMRAAVATLASPDADSRTPDHEGRRIEPIEGGWRILNYRAYRARGQDREGSKAPAMRAYRRRLLKQTGNALPNTVTDGNALPESITRYPEERGERKDPPNPPCGGRSGDGSRDGESPRQRHGSSDLYVDESIAERAGRFLDRYQAIYRRVRNGAFYALKPARDHAYACKLVSAWADPDHLDKMAELFLRREARDWKNEPGTPGQFLHMAPQCDAMLRANGITPRQVEKAS